MYQEQIEQLVVLQQVDDKIIVLQAEVDNAPKKLAALEDKLVALNTRRELIQEKLDILVVQQGKLNDEIEEDSGKIKLSKNKLMQVENTKEYHAMMREMDSLEKMNRSREEEKEAVRDELDRQNAFMEEISRDETTIKEEYESLKSTLDVRVAAATKSLDSLAKKRKKACKVIPAPIFARYDFIRTRMDNPVIVSVVEGVCNGCHIKIPPQNYNDLQKGQQILSCPNCQRLIFWAQPEAEAE